VTFIVYVDSVLTGGEALKNLNHTTSDIGNRGRRKGGENKNKELSGKKKKTPGTLLTKNGYDKRTTAEGRRP